MTDTPVVSQPLILLVVGGDPALAARVPVALPAGSVVVAADSGLDRVPPGLPVDHVVGDLDSVTGAALDAAQTGGAAVHRFPADKDATDIELALGLVVDRVVPASGLTALLVVGAGAGRLDHLLADLLVLTSPLLAGLDVTARLGPATVTVVRPGQVRTLRGAPGEQVSLLPLHGPADGVATDGLRWSLVDAHLAPGTTRGMSNEFDGTDAAVRIGAGVVAAVQPGTTAAPIDPRTTTYDPTPRSRGDHPS